MGVDVNLLIIRKADGCVVKERWLGRSSTRDKALEVLNQAPKLINHALSYQSGSSQEIEKINAESGYRAIPPQEMQETVKKYPDRDFVWAILMDW